MQNITKIDKNAKEILSNKSLLSFFMKELIPDYKDIDKHEIEKLIEFSDDKAIIGSNREMFTSGNKIVFDLLVTPRLPNSEEKIGMFINIEFQNTSNMDELLDRSIRYASALISRQVGKKNNRHYLKDVYSIWICTLPRKQERDTIYKASLFLRNIAGKGSRSSKELSKLNIIFINIGGKYPMNDINEKILNVCNLLFENKPTIKARDIITILDEKYDILIGEEEVNKVASFEQAMFDLGYEKATVDYIVKMVDSGIPKEKAFDILNVNDYLKDLVTIELKKKHK